MWFAAGVPPDELWKGTAAPISAEAARLKAVLRPLVAKERQEYADVTRLDNAAGSGWLPRLLEVERQIIAETHAFVETNPANEALAAFQRKMAARALATLAAIEAAPRPAQPATASLAAPAVAEGVVFQRAGEHANALASFDKALSLDGGHAEALALRCRSLAALGRHDEVRAACGSTHP
ncbi:MAG: hypothetical protein JNM38_02065 [Acidobacteria bacterium]|nr:hypothetical protein [Acidobacteriota bacterium]